MMSSKTPPPRPLFSLGLGLVLTFALVACAPSALGSSGSVTLITNLPDEALVATAAKQPGLKFKLATATESWERQLAAGKGAPDLVLLDWDNRLAEAGAAGLVADLSRYWKRLAAPKGIGKSLASSVESPDGKTSFFLPSSFYPWGLFYNVELLKKTGLALPTTMEEFEAALPKLAAKGLTPIALGASYGWPALAWLSILDIRLNGIEAQRSLAEGRRRFDDKGLLEVYATLQRWRDAGYFGPGAASRNWEDSFAAVEKGQAAFVYLGASALSRYARASALGFVAVPPGRGEGSRGELAVIHGFALSAHAVSSEAALALADAYVVAGAPGQTADSWTLAASVGSVKAGELGDLKAAESRIAEGAGAFLPQLDWALPAAASYEARSVMKSFFEKGSRMDAKGLAAALVKAVGK